MPGRAVSAVVEGEMSKRLFALIVFTGWLFFHVGYASQAIGTMPLCTPFKWTLIPVVMAFTLIPYALGLISGGFEP